MDEFNALIQCLMLGVVIVNTKLRKQPVAESVEVELRPVPMHVPERELCPVRLAEVLAASQT
jgi:hypothetical protein